MGVLVAVSGVSCFLLSCSLALSLCLEIIRNLEASWVLGKSGAIWKPSWAVLKLLLGPMSHVDAVGRHPAELFTLRESPPAQPKTATLAKSTDYRDLLVIFSATMPRGPEELL